MLCVASRRCGWATGGGAEVGRERFKRMHVTVALRWRGERRGARRRVNSNARAAGREDRERRRSWSWCEVAVQLKVAKAVNYFGVLGCTFRTPSLLF